MNTKIAPFAAACLLACVESAAADPVEDFYRTATIQLAAPTEAGDGYDATTRWVGRHLGRFIPGSPKIVVQNRIGAAGLQAANYTYEQAPRDGTFMALLHQTSALSQAKGDPGVRYDAARYNWIGSPISPVEVFAVWSNTGIKTMDDAKRISVAIGATGQTAQNFIYPKLANELLGTKFKIVLGYAGGAGMNLAMERNETQGRGAYPWLLLKATRGDWLRDGRLSLLAHPGLEPLPDAPQMPRYVDIAPTPEAKSVFELNARVAGMGRPFVMPPDVPTERVAAVRRAFAAMLTDSEFMAEADKMQEEVKYTSGEKLKELVDGILRVDAATMDRFRNALAAH